jgi:hypothetical protein
MSSIGHHFECRGSRFRTRTCVEGELFNFVKGIVEEHLHKNPKSEIFPDSKMDDYKEELSYFFYEINNRDLSFLSESGINGNFATQVSLCLKGPHSYFKEDLKYTLVEDIYNHYRFSIQSYIDNAFVSIKNDWVEGLYND